MKKEIWIVILVFTASAAFAAGWRVEHFRAKSWAENDAGRLIEKGESKLIDCDSNTDPRIWKTKKRTLDFRPHKTSYTVVWETCAPGIGGDRVRVLSGDGQKVLYEYEDDEIVSTNIVELLGGKEEQLLIVTGSAGTNTSVDWNFLSEVDGELKEWSWPDYNTPAEKLLQADDEDTCCKDWSVGMRGRHIVLARGIYHKGLDGNCCPSRGGILVWLKPIPQGFKVESVRRIGVRELERWRRGPFCDKCTLVE